jgi:glycogen(starch) synthase
VHILHLSWEYPPLVYGGIGRHVPALAAAQAARGDRVTVVTQGIHGAQEHESVSGVEVVRVDPEAPFPYHLPSLLTWVGALDARIGHTGAAMREVDVVHAHDWVVARAGRVASDAHGVPLVATVHATEAGRHSGWLPDTVSRSVHLVEQWLVDEADAVIVCSAAMADEVARAHDIPLDKISVIPNGIDAGERPAAGAIDPALRTGSPRITFVGRLEWEKGVFTAVAALPAVLDHHTQARLRMVGTGGQEQALQRAIADGGLEASVDLLGHVDEQTLADVYASSDLLIAPSSYEPFGIVALEAAAAGVPLVVGDTGGLAEFVTEQRGRRCRPNDPDDLAAQILAALADPTATARRRDAAALALSDYTWARIAARTDAVYAHTRRGPRTPRRLTVPANPVL